MNACTYQTSKTNLSRRTAAGTGLCSPQVFFFRKKINKACVFPIADAMTLLIEILNIMQLFNFESCGDSRKNPVCLLLFTARRPALRKDQTRVINNESRLIMVRYGLFTWVPLFGIR